MTDITDLTVDLIEVASVLIMATQIEIVDVTMTIIIDLTTDIEIETIDLEEILDMIDNGKYHLFLLFFSSPN